MIHWCMILFNFIQHIKLLHCCMLCITSILKFLKPWLILFSDGDAIKVFVRIRPPDSYDNDRGCQPCVSVNDNKTAVIVQSKPDPKTFTFDHVADHEDTQVRNGFNKSVRNMLSKWNKVFVNMCFIIGKKTFWIFEKKIKLKSLYWMINMYYKLNFMFQESVFTIMGKKIIESCVKGYNGTIFA